MELSEADIQNIRDAIDDLKRQGYHISWEQAEKSYRHAKSDFESKMEQLKQTSPESLSAAVFTFKLNFRPRSKSS